MARTTLGGGAFMELHPLPSPPPSRGREQAARTSGLYVDVPASFAELAGLLLQPDGDDLVFPDAELLGVVAHVLGDAHAAEVRAAHRAEVRHFGRLDRQGLVVE